MPLLLTVENSFRVPGLGIVAQGTSDASLRQFALHTPLLVQVVFPDGRQEEVTATVEELIHANAAHYVLLVEFLNPTLLPPGSQVLSTESILVSDNSIENPDIS